MLSEELEKMKADLKAFEDKPEEEIVEEIEDKEETPEPPKEEPKEEAKEEPKEEKPDDSAFARMRRENAALAKRVKELESPKEATKEAPEPEEEFRQRIAEVVQDHQITRAEKEFQSYEERFKATTKDYDVVASDYVNFLYKANQAKNPRKGHAEIAEMTKLEILTRAGHYVREGLDPIEEMYNDAKSLGFGQTRAEPKEEPKPEPKPNLTKVVENRSRSAGMNTGGGGEGQMTREYVPNLTNEQWSKLPVAEKKRLMYGQ